MKTLIELYDEVPIENVLAADTFLPERIIYLCPDEIAKDKEKQKIHDTPNQNIGEPKKETDEDTQIQEEKTQES